MAMSAALRYTLTTGPTLLHEDTCDIRRTIEKVMIPEDALIGTRLVSGRKLFYGIKDKIVLSDKDAGSTYCTLIERRFLLYYAEP